SGNLIFAEENSNYTRTGHRNTARISNGGNVESMIQDDSGYRNKYLRSQFHSFKLFHFHDTSFNSRVKQPCNTQDYASLQEDGGNLAAFLYMLQEAHPKHFRIIELIVQSIAPFFDRFYLRPDEINPSQIFLRWKEKGSDQLFTAHNLSD